NNFVCFFYVTNGLVSESPPLEPDQIQTIQFGMVSCYADIGWNVQGHCRRSADHAIGTDSHKLMHSHNPADDGVIVDGNMSSERHGVCHDDIVPKLAVMRHVGISHKKIFVADLGFSVFFGGSPVYGSAFPDDVVIADNQVRLFVLVPDVLGGHADAGKRVDMVPLSDGCPALDHYMRRNLRIFAYGYVFADDGIGSYLHSLGQRGLGMYYCCRMYAHNILLQFFDHLSLSTIMAIISASATSAPSTFASALRLVILPRILRSSSSNRT